MHMLQGWKIWTLIAGAALLGLIYYGATRPLDGTAHAQTHKAEMDLDAFNAAITKFHHENARYPSDDEGLGAALALTAGEASRHRRPTDPWGHAYAYHYRANEAPAVYSFGPNGADEAGTGDDISLPKPGD